jgi:hypothetical protein
MKPFETLLTLALLAGCAQNASSTLPQSAQAQTELHGRAGSWMLPEAKSEDLLYASYVGQIVYVYSYPSGKEVGELTNFASGYYPQGLCADSSGDVFVTAPEEKNSSQSIIYEYAHGGTNPIATLSDPGSAIACAVDPTTGNLAVANAFTGGYGDGDVAIYQDAQGTASVYSDSNIEIFYYCTYDNQGNLFGTGFNEYYASNVLVELPEGTGGFKGISLSKSFDVGSIQWTGRSLAAAAITPTSRGEQPVYQIEITGSAGTVSGPTLLWSRRDKKNADAVQFWVQGGTIVGPDYDRGLELWRYPKGGKPTEVIDAPVLFFGVAISK